MLKYKNRKQKFYLSCLKEQNGGFTFVEILVVMVTMTVLFGLGSANYRDFSRRKALEGAVSKVEADLRLAQAQALAGKKPDDSKCNSPETLNGYEFTLQNVTQYRIYAKCTGGDVEQKKETIGDGGFKITVSPDSIIFNVLGRGTNVPAGSTATISIEQVDAGNFAVIEVSPEGEIHSSFSAYANVCKCTGIGHVIDSQNKCDLADYTATCIDGGSACECILNE